MKCPNCDEDITEPLQLGVTIGNTQLKGCPECGIVFIILPSNESRPSQVGEKVKDVFGRLDKLRGYRPPKRKAEAASIIRMLKNYSPDQIITAWETLKQDKFWQVKELFMMTVESQIGAILKNGAYQAKYGKSPARYTKPEELLQ